MTRGPQWSIPVQLPPFHPSKSSALLYQAFPLAFKQAQVSPSLKEKTIPQSHIPFCSSSQSPVGRNCLFSRAPCLHLPAIPNSLHLDSDPTILPELLGQLAKDSHISWTFFSYLLFLKKDFIYLLLERREGRERGKETSVCGFLLHASYWGPGPHPRHVP